MSNEKLTKTQIDTLNQYQKHWDTESFRLNFVCLPALDMYKKIHGDIRVLPPFVIPFKAPWPENLWEMKLGSQVLNWRSHRFTLTLHFVQAFNKRDFTWEVQKKILKHSLLL